MKTAYIFLFSVELPRKSYHKHVLPNPRFSDYTHVLQDSVVDQGAIQIHWLLYSESMVMRDIGSFHCPTPTFISSGAAEGNKHRQGAMETACIPK